MSSRLIHLTTVVLALGSIVNAADIQWTDLGADHLWSNPENWDLGRVPTLEDDVKIDVPAAAEPNGPVIQDGIAAEAHGIFTEAPGVPTLTMTGGSLQVANWIWWGDGTNSFGVWTMSGGTVTVADEFELGWDGGAGTLTMTGGTINAGEAVIPTGSGAFGELFLYGGTYNVTKPGGLSVKDNGLIDITKGTLVLEGDETAKVNDLIAAGLITAYEGRGQFELDYDNRNPGKTTLTAVGRVLTVEPDGDIAAANAIAEPGDTIEIAEGTYVLMSQIAVKDGVTYRGAGAGLTVIDGNNVTRAFVAWGDRGATDGQVDANGVGIPNLTGPKDWVLGGLTIQDCVADAANRQDILSAARDLLNNYTGAPYTLETAQAENGGITSNPEWFEILSGGADDDLTDAELQAYLDTNPPGSAGHLVVNDTMDTGGGALILRNGAAGAVQNCSFLNNQAPLNSGDGGAMMTGNTGTALTIDSCEFVGNSCDDGGGALRVSSNSTCTITGTTFTGNQAIGDSADGGAIMIANSGTTLAIDNCEFNGNSCVDGGGAIRLGGNTSVRTITGSTFVGNYITGDGGDGGAVKCDGDDSTYVLTDCSFIGNTAMDDGGAVRYNPDRCEVTVTNCAFIGNGKDADGNPVGDDGGAWHTGDDDAGPVTFENCLFADNACVDDRIIEVKAAFAFLNCTFVGNEPGDEALIGVRGRDWDSTGDGEDDMTTDDSIIANCLFINNTLLSNKEIIGDTRNDVFAPTVINCLFFGNLDQNGDPAINADGNSTEAGTIDVGAVTDAMEIVVDPLGDYHLVVGSPAIDASDPDTATEADIEGTAAEGARDVGAYEFVGL